MVVSFESLKGGQGLTSTMCGVGLSLAADGYKVSIGDSLDVFALLGLSDPLEGYGEKEVVSGHSSLYVFENEANPHSDIVLGENLYGADKRILVIQPCYLALRRAMKNRNPSAYDGIITFMVEGRALKPRDVEDVIGLPIIGSIPWIPEIARSIDAGVLNRNTTTYSKLAKKIASM